MTPDEKARAEAERRWPYFEPSTDESIYPASALRNQKVGAFSAGAAWQRSQSGEVTEEMVEAAAKAIYEADPLPRHDETTERIVGAKPWHWLGEEFKGHKRILARAALSAALPFLRPEPSEDERDLIGLLASHGEYVEVETAIQYVRDADLTRRPMPSRDEVAAMLVETPQSEGSDWAYALADAVLAAITDTEKK